jgi:kynurenine formamidase
MSAAEYQLVDVSHTVEDGLITYKGLPAPIISDHLSRQESRSVYSEGTEFQIGKIEMVANTGTYIDSPFHRFADGADLADLPIERTANLKGITVSVDTGEHRAIEIGVDALAGIEGKAVLFHTGWSQHWNSQRYFDGYPFLTKNTAILLRDAGVALVGIDSLNIDDANDGSRPVHTILLEAGIPVVEHLTNLQLLPDRGYRFFATPVKIRAFGSFPVRAFAIVQSV